MILKIADYKLKCIIDRIDAGPVIIDYKTGNPRYVQNNQLNLYAYALGEGKYIPCRLVYQFLKTGNQRSWEYTPQIHANIECWLIDAIKKIEISSVFYENRTILCAYCGVARYCRL